jgi:hypothetical protein
MKITFVRDGCAVTIESVDDSAVDLYKSIAWAPAKSEKAEEVRGTRPKIYNSDNEKCVPEESVADGCMCSYEVGSGGPLCTCGKSKYYNGANSEYCESPRKNSPGKEVTKKEIQKFIDDDVKEFLKKTYSSGNIQVGVKKQA